MRKKLLPPWITTSVIRGAFKFLGIFLTLVTVISFLFLTLKRLEGEQYSLIDAVYWTLTTMSTLGYGDITFTTPVGRLFSVFVLLSGIFFLLVILPAAFINLFYEPWRKARSRNRVPRVVDEKLSGHIILTYYGPISSFLIQKLIDYDYPYVLILPNIEQVIELNDKGFNAIHGELNDPISYQNANVKSASLVATTRSDVANTTIVFTVQTVAPEIPVIATVRNETSEQVLKLAGCRSVLDLTRLTASALARRVKGGRQFSHIIGKLDDLLIAEVHASETNLVGQPFSLAQTSTAVSIVGFWQRGRFEIGEYDMTVSENDVLVLAGSRQQLKEFNQTCKSESACMTEQPVIIVGGGRVGRATAVELEQRGIPNCIIEQDAIIAKKANNTIVGSGSDKEVLEAAGIEETSTVIITTSDDETNVYLTILVRLLRDNVQIISRSTQERSVAALHRAGADLVMSYASMGANALFNLLQRSDLLMVAEGLDVFKVAIPKALAGKKISEIDIRERTQCSIIGIDTNNQTQTNPSSETLLPETGEIVLIGTPEGETKFMKEFNET